MKLPLRILLISTILFSALLLSAGLKAQVNPGPGAPIFDPCSTLQGSSIAKSSVSVAITAATTTSLVTPVTGSAIYVCSFSLSVSNVVTTANTIQFEYGTGATCGTGTTVLTGAYNTGSVTAGVPSILVAGGNQTLFSTPVSQRLCAVTTIGATAAFSGVLTYIQQ